MKKTEFTPAAADMVDLPDMPEGDIEVEKEPDHPIQIRTRQLPQDIYRDVDDSELERLLPYLIGVRNTDRLKALAEGRGAKPLAMLRLGIYESQMIGKFHPANFDAVKGKRTGNDERDVHVTNQRLLTVLGQTNFDTVRFHAREHKISNIECLYRAFNHALETQCI